MKERILCWNGSWLSIYGKLGFPASADDSGIENMLALWDLGPICISRQFEVDRESIEKIGGHMVERRPDRMDCEHIPHNLLSKLYDDCGQMRSAVVPFDHRSVLFVEGHSAMFYHNFRLPMPRGASEQQAHLAIRTMLHMCDTNQAKPEWLMCFRCRVCGGYVLAVEGKGRLVEYFTGYIDKEFGDVDKICKLPDDYPAKTCIDCGDITLTGQEALEVGIKPSEEEMHKFLDERVTG